MTDAELESIRALVEALPGKFTVSVSSCGPASPHHPPEVTYQLDCNGKGVMTTPTRKGAEAMRLGSIVRFCAQAPADIRALLAEVDRLRKEVASFDERTDEMKAEWEEV